MKIYWFKAQAPLRVLALAKHLRLDPEYIEVDMMGGALASPDYRALNPNGKAPLLVDGEFVLWESGAIMAYLCTHTGSDMWPNDAAGQIEMLRWLIWGESHWSSAVAPWYFEHIVKPTFGIGVPDPQAYTNAGAALDRYAPVLEAQLQAHRFVALDRLTIADFSLASMARYWQVCAMPLQQYPGIQRWLDDLLTLDAWDDPWPPSRYALTSDGDVYA